MPRIRSRSIHATARPYDVLVVDDDASIREAIHTFLEGKGYTVSEAANGSLMIGRLDAIQGGLIVLLDLTMPVMDGIAVLEAAEQQGDLLQRHALALHLQELGVPMLAKPFDLDTLHALVREADGRLA